MVPWYWLIAVSLVSLVGGCFIGVWVYYHILLVADRVQGAIEAGIKTAHW